jgi:hypothetical protein
MSHLNGTVISVRVALALAALLLAPTAGNAEQEIGPGNGNNGPGSSGPMCTVDNNCVYQPLTGGYMCNPSLVTACPSNTRCPLQSSGQFYAPSSVPARESAACQ